MPYSVKNPPDKLKKLSPKKQRQWVHVFNSCWEEHHDEGKCHAMAWGTVKKTGCDGDAICEALEGLILSAPAEDCTLSRDWKEMNRRQRARRDPEGIEMNEVQIAAELMAVAKVLEDIDGMKTAGLLGDLRAAKIAGVVTGLFGRIVGLKNDISEALTALQHEAEDSDEVKEILKNVPGLKEVLQLGKELRDITRKIPRRDEVQSRIIQVLTVG